VVENVFLELHAHSRAKTALRRHKCSRPLALALSDGLINRTRSFFDFGCGHGGDVQYLRRERIKADGWDPFHCPGNPIVPAEVVNLGYVLNVIEDAKERAETLRRAFKLSRKVLVVSVRVEHELVGIAEFADGVVTTKGTFQKIYTQTEFKEFVAATLQHSVHVAGLGILYVFSDSQAESDFVASQAFSRRMAYRAELIRQFTRDRIGKQFVLLANNLGRIPLPSEFAKYDTLVGRFGSPDRIARLTLAKIDPTSFAGSKEQKREDILTYIAICRLQGVKLPPMRSLPLAVQADIRSIWSDYRSALADGEQFLFSIGDPARVKGAFSSVSFGKPVCGDLYLHRSCEDDLPSLLRIIIFAGKQIVGDVGYNVIKLSTDGRKISFLYYKDFDVDPHPALRFGARVYLPKAEYQIKDFSSSVNPPILHRKDCLVAPTYPYYQVFHDLSDAEDRAGLLSRPEIGFQKQWNDLLTLNGFKVEGHTLQRSAWTSPI
jgi:DNA phosphorothioation-associated putative methyltransferase